MFESTGLLSYVVVFFLAYVYLPYTFFKFCAERFIDLGRRRDATQLEEIISAFLPSVILHVQAYLVFSVLSLVRRDGFAIYTAIFAGIFGDDPGPIADYIFAGDWGGTLIYIALVWGFAVVNGLWFGWAALAMCRTDEALHGLSEAWGRATGELTRFQRVGWLLWFPFFHESVVPLFTWHARRPHVIVETKDKRVFYGQFISYEKTTDGKLDAIRLKDVRRHRFDEEKTAAIKTATAIDTLYLNWSEISDINVVMGKTEAEAEQMAVEMAKIKIQERQETA